ncbi:hypothetical protein C6361_25445 [Plantactinospora sp. BC1]|uniref:hypothetical protein n=1 Tax=Plantactinospora sp. BC1 TaxID=2108470 RepID=UPI000D15E194|nr:hypothetical protein [Plantactinospora sp. BC1]AVT32246.1 hypothetical protein C6361_25445 [Plantactinospora sp. BC1]
MTLRLSGGVVPGPDTRVWAAGPRGRAVAPSPELAPGSPVVLGPRSATPEAAERAVAELGRLVTVGGVLAAGAGVDLGDGFRSARTEGAAGDRRDAVLSALLVPALGGRLGDRRAVLVALFGPDATKPLGAAAQAVLDEGRWPVLRFAVAASDVLGPEQLVRILELRAPDGVDPFPGGLPSVVGGHLTRVLREVPRPRRLALLTDLWQRVCAHGVQQVRRERLRASQGRQDRSADLTVRYHRYEEDELTERLRTELWGEPTILRAALWQPSPGYWLTRAKRVLQDAMAATVLARVAVSAVDRGLDAALTAHRHEIEAAVAELSPPEASRSARRISGLTGLPARPGSYLRDILARTAPGERPDPRWTPYLDQRLARARDYGRIMLDVVAQFVTSTAGLDSASAHAHLSAWAGSPLDVWRHRVGYLSPDRPARWDQQPILSSDPTPPLAERLRAAPDRTTAEVETIGDLLWYAELADALAGLNGHPAAVITPRPHAPVPDTDPTAPDEPLVPRPQSIPLAVAGAAQLVDLGGQLPPRCRSWSELVAGLSDQATIAAALTGAFTVPAPVERFDGTVLPGTDARIELARTARQLADWSDYMGNCIAGPHYVEDATRGRSVLVALRAPDGRILLNAELRPSARGWRLEEIRARFNQDPDPTLRHRTTAWLADLALPERTVPQPRRAARHDGTGAAAPRTGRRPASAVRVLRDLGRRLDEAAADTVGQPDILRAAEVLALLATRLAGAPATPPADPHDALTALRRATPGAVLQACRLTLADPAGPGPVALWRASGDRPLARAVQTLAPSTVAVVSAGSTGGRTVTVGSPSPGLPRRATPPSPPAPDRLAPLLRDAPLPGSLRPVARVGHVAVARTADLVALRVRVALGTLLRQDCPELADGVRSRPHAGLLRAAALAVTSWSGLRTGGPDPGSAPVRFSAERVTVVVPRRRVRVPGFPQSSLRDESWQSSWPDAVELGAVPDGFWERIAGHGLLLPSSWLAGGGWAALWSRANGPWQQATER